jgi:hypothetical protein
MDAIAKLKRAQNNSAHSAPAGYSVATFPIKACQMPSSGCLLFGVPDILEIAAVAICALQLVGQHGSPLEIERSSPQTAGCAFPTRPGDTIACRPRAVIMVALRCAGLADEQCRRYDCALILLL